MRQGTFGESLACALIGITTALKSERNMKIHLAAAVIAVLFGIVFQINRLEWGLLSLTIFFVLVAELINTAVEKTVDLITSQYHPLARAAKNIAAGAVLLSALNAIIMAFIIYGPHLL